MERKCTRCDEPATVAERRGPWIEWYCEAHRKRARISGSIITNRMRHHHD